MAVMSEEVKVPEFDETLLDILRCPVAVHETGESDDPGRLRIVRGCWLVCDDSGYKYPIREGIPIMLEDIGEEYKDIADADLPVPPPLV